MDLPRQIAGLQWARPLAAKPTFRPEPRPSPAKRAGLAYERRVAATVGFGRHGDWFEFLDSSGPGYCQPDIWGPDGKGGIVVLECKLTWTLSARLQIQGLYGPVLEHIFKCPARGVIICKNLLPTTPRGLVYGDLREAMGRATSQNPTICHWPGKFPGALRAGEA